jgi:hypothetical protein
MTRLATISILVLAATVSLAQTAPVSKPATATQTTTSSTTSTVSTTTANKSSKKKAHKHAKPESAKVEQPAPPPPPPTLAQQPPVPPTVTYRNGLLSIDAPNSTLGDVLNAVRRATGAVIEGPTSVGDRVIVHLGPGQPRQVVASLLGSSRFDFVVMGTPQQPNGINRLMLMARQGSSQPAANNNYAGAPNAAPQPRPAVAADSDEEDQDSADRDDNSDAPPSQPAQPQQASPAQAPQLPPDQMAPQQGQQQQDQNQNQDANPNAPKTPEQLYKELQTLERQRQQQQNQNQNQNQNNAEPPPPQ